MDVNKFIANGKELGLEGSELKLFVNEQVEAWKQQANEEREERHRQREAEKQKAEMEQQNKRLEMEHLERLEHIKLETAKIESETSKVKSEDHSNLDGSMSFQNVKPKLKMPYFEDGKEDMDAYLRRFERVVGAQGLDKAGWATHLAVLLKGRALEVYVRLTSEQAADYDKVKAALLKRYDLTEDGFRRRFRSTKIESGESYGQYLQRLRNYLARWIQLSNTTESFEGVIDLLLKEQILNSSDYEMSLFLRERAPASSEEMATLAEQYCEARHGMGAEKRKSWNSGQSRRTPGNSFQRKEPETPSAPQGQRQQTSYIPPSERECDICSRKGHMARFCPNNHNQSRSYKGNVGSCNTQQYTTREFMFGVHDGKAVKILRDTGCISPVAILKRDLLPKHLVSCREDIYRTVDGTAKTAMFCSVYLHTSYYTGETEAIVLDNPMCDIIIGNIPGARERDDPNPTWTELQVQLVGAVETRAQKEKAKQHMKPLKTLKVDDVDVDATDMRKAQEADETLSKIRELAKNKVTRRVRGNESSFVYNNGLLMRQFISPRVEQGKLFTQLVVPKQYREHVMKIGHESMMAGHLAARKSLDRIQRQFYWPGIQNDVRRFCRSCDICQRTIHKGKVQRLPLGHMPIIDTPFDRVAVDLVGPLDPVTDRKNRYILTMVDYATRYPEAVPLANIDTETVAEALVSIFSRVGVPREILTDMGTQFTSDLMKEVGRLLSIKQLTTTPYHPICNGLVERFNGTLKSMLKKMCSERPKDWDRYIMPLLFAYREVPQESLGFSPFELLYGRTVRGPMIILRELWTQEIPDSEVRTTYHYVLDLKERLQETCQLARDMLSKSSKRYRKYYNTKSRDRSFKDGDKVLLLLPSQSNKLLMQWKGPFDIVSKQGFADYKVQVGDKVKTFHANLLKKYVDRTENTENQTTETTDPLAPVVCSMVIDGEAEIVDIHTESHIEPPPLQQTETYQDVHVSQELEQERSQTVQEILQEYPEVLSDLPGRTHLEEIDLKLTTTEPVRAKVYPVPYHLRDVVASEVDQMLKMGVIEPSKSSYTSPIILLKKKDTTYRFVSDFRQLNKVTVFDAEPIPKAEDLFSKLSKAKFYTKLDLTKGYWQCSVSEECREMTAFVTPQGIFQWRVMPFGLVNAPAVFTRMMRKLLHGLDDVENYIDDILIFSETWEDHLKTLRQVLERLKSAGLTAKPSKCFVGYESLEFLGHVVGTGDLKPESGKVEKILNVSRPVNKKQLRSFMGLIGYYNKFIPNFSAVAAPLTDMTRKGTPNHLFWGERQVQALESLKKLMATAPILKLPDLEKPFILRTDASDTGLGAVLLQEHDGEKYPVKYVSRKLHRHEQHYATIEKECLAIVWAVDKLMVYLYGREFQLETDHKPLVWLNQAKINNSRIMRWALLLQPFRFVLRSIPGVENVGADLLSRCGTDE